jgi:hypothetical protein
MLPAWWGHVFEEAVTPSPMRKAVTLTVSRLARLLASRIALNVESNR